MALHMAERVVIYPCYKTITPECIFQNGFPENLDSSGLEANGCFLFQICQVGHTYQHLPQIFLALGTITASFLRRANTAIITKIGTGRNTMYFCNCGNTARFLTHTGSQYMGWHSLNQTIFTGSNRLLCPSHS